MDNVENTSKAVELCDALMRDCYDGRISFPVELSSRVRGIKAAIVEELDHFREAEKMVGNFSAIRNALEEIDKNTDLLDIADDIGPNIHPSHSFVAVKIHKIARAAISKPPRNCDRLQTVEDAKTAWNNYKMSCPTPPGGWGDVDLLDWFLAKAEGDEG